VPVYLDNNASTPLDARVLEAMQPYLSGPYGNPSSLHRFGRAARDALEAARAQLAQLLDAQPQEVVWTSGATESNNLALRGSVLAAAPGGCLLYGATEHPAVLETAEALGRHGQRVAIIAVDEQGLVRWPEFERQLADGPVTLVALMRANNETGVLQDVARAAELARAHHAPLLVDAVQALGKVPLSFAETGADLMSVTAHKLHGPRGAGALLVRSGTALEPLLSGGGQERGLRGGTENLAAIVGFGAAAALAVEELAQRHAHCLALRERLEAGLAALGGVTVFAAAAPRLPTTVQFGLEGFEGEALLMQLDRRGFAVSSGSACSSGKGEPSHVLVAMGVPHDLAYSAVRVSVSKETTPAQVEAFLAALGEIKAAAAAAA
jgi:cysteine desulfurase